MKYFILIECTCPVKTIQIEYMFYCDSLTLEGSNTDKEQVYIYNKRRELPVETTGIKAVVTALLLLQQGL